LEGGDLLIIVLRNVEGVVVQVVDVVELLPSERKKRKSSGGSRKTLYTLN
jgi:ribosomal protein S28E/S33